MSFEFKVNLSPDASLSLETIFSDLFIFVDALCSDYGDPVTPDAQEFESLKMRIVAQDDVDSLFRQQHFYLIERVKGEVLFAHNVDKYLGLKGSFDLMDFHAFIQDGQTGWHYLQDYLSWGKIAYLFFKEIKNFEDLKTFSFKIHLPMKCADGNVYWVLQESKPFEFDANGNMLSHLNIYTVCRIYDLEKPVPLHGEFYRNDWYSVDWNELLMVSRLMVAPFILTPVQKEIVQYFFTHPKATRQSCANALKYPLNTIKKYISDSQYKQGILDKAHAAFPHIPLYNLKDVIDHLVKIGLLDDACCGYKK